VIEPLMRTMSGQIALRIRDKILAGVYAPGAPLLKDSSTSTHTAASRFADFPAAKSMKCFACGC
jgi:hypothetical protein